jgi:hypothetical protein
MITIKGRVSIPYLASLHPTECRQTLDLISSLHDLKPELVRHVEHIIEQERHQQYYTPILAIRTWNDLHMTNPPQLARDTNNHDELINMNQLDNQWQHMVHEWSAEDTASRSSEDILYMILMLAWHHGTTRACAVLSIARGRFRREWNIRATRTEVSHRHDHS